MNPIGIASNCSGELCQKEIRLVTDMGSLAVGDFYAWSSAYAMPDTAFAIKFTMVNGEHKDHFLYFYSLFVMVSKLIF